MRTQVVAFLFIVTLLISFQNCTNEPSAPSQSSQAGTAVFNLSIRQDGIMGAIAAEDPSLSVVMDFSDEAEFNDSGAPSFLDLKTLQRRISSYKKMGIKRIYFRTDVGAFPTYQSSIRPAFRAYSAAGSERFVETLAHYDPLAQVIALAKPLGIEVYAYAQLYDTACSKCFYSDSQKAAKWGEYPLADPFFLKNPQYQWTSKEAAEALAFKRSETGISVITLTSRKMNPRLRPQDVKIRYYRDVSQYDLQPNLAVAEVAQYIVHADASSGQTVFEFRLKKPIPRGFITIEQPFKDDHVGPDSFGNSLNEMVTLYSNGLEAEPSLRCLLTKGAAWPSVANPNSQCVTPEKLGPGAQFALDYQSRAIVLYTNPDYIVGMPSYAYKESRDWKKSILQEIVKNYAVDGVALCLRTHSYIQNPLDYDYAKPIVDRFKAVYGKFPFDDSEETRVRLSGIRFEFLRTFLEELNPVLGGKPVHLMLPPMNQADLIGRYQVNQKVRYYKYSGLAQEASGPALGKLLDDGLVQRFLLWGAEDVTNGCADASGKPAACSAAGATPLDPDFNSGWAQELEAQFKRIPASKVQNPHLLFLDFTLASDPDKFETFIRKGLAENRLRGLVLYESLELYTTSPTALGARLGEIKASP